MKKPTQQERILEALKRHPEGLSMRYFERELMISQSTARVSELRSKGYDIQPIGEDEYGFTIQKLMDEPKRKVTTFEPVLDESGRQIAVRQVTRTV